jgi:diacylglycerol kinase (ATP)
MKSDPTDSHLTKRVKSFGYAFKGLWLFLSTQPNGWIHLLAVAVVSGGGLWYGITTTEWLLCFLCFGLVIAVEIVNTAIEFLVDHLSPGFHSKAGAVKDLAAAAVLVAAGIAAMVGVAIFWPYIMA